MIKEKGAIISIYLHEKDYMMTQIANIIETNNAKILGSYILSTPEILAEIEVVIKINRSDIRDIIQTFERYEYKVNVMLDNDGFQDDMHDRFNQFMNYLNI